MVMRATLTWENSAVPSFATLTALCRVWVCPESVLSCASRSSEIRGLAEKPISERERLVRTNNVPFRVLRRNEFGFLYSKESRDLSGIRQAGTLLNFPLVNVRRHCFHRDIGIHKQAFPHRALRRKN